MSSVSPPQRLDRSNSVYKDTLTSTWDTIEQIQTSFQELPWFGTHRFDSEVIELRQQLHRTISLRSPLEDGESFRDFHTMKFLYHSMHAIIYSPQIHALPSNEDRQDLRNQLALELQLGATKALVAIANDRRAKQSEEAKHYQSGSISELASISLLNRRAVVSETNSLVVPASRREDREEKIDIKSLVIAPDGPVLPIQIKTGRKRIVSVPQDVLLIYAEDAIPSLRLTTKEIESDYNRSTFDKRKLLNARGLAIARFIRRSATPEAQEALYKQMSQLNRELRRRNPLTPRFTQSLRDNPVLQQLYGAMKDESES